MDTRKETLLRTLRGLLVAALITLGEMVLLSGGVVVIGIGDEALFILNQAAKILSIFAGVYAAVGVGGERGFITGAAVGILYMVLGYALYYALNGGISSAAVMLGEMLLGMLLGALSGAVTANLRPVKRRRKV